MMTKESLAKKKLAKKIYDLAHLKGDFLLRSGARSSEYFDKYRFESQPEVLEAIAKQMLPLIPSKTEVLAALEMGGIPIGTALSLQTGLPCIFVRKKAKNYGTCKLAEGFDFKNKQTCIIEDVITTGGQVVESTRLLREQGAKINHVLCVIHRGENTNKLDQISIQMKALFNAEELNA